MPYDNVSDLPDGVQNNLPEHAQTIYMEAYNSAWKQYKDPDKRRNEASREEVAHQVAWSAVEQSYHKNDQGNWVKRGD